MKAEQFIKDCTRSCSNETTTLGSYDHTYHKWLTPEQALAAVEIAREEMIDTLELKEVDLDKERRKYLTEHFNVYEDGILQSKRSCMPLDTFDIVQVAKHFFELGLKTKGE